MVPVWWGIRGNTNGNNISLRFRERRGLVMVLKTILGQMISSTTNKAENFIPQILILRLIVVIKNIVLIFRKRRLSTKLIFVKPMLLEGLREKLTRALNKIGLRMRNQIFANIFEKNDVYPQWRGKQENHQR